MNKKWTREYRGFESINDFDEDWMDEALPSIVPSGEYQGTIRITFEYIPTQEELEIEEVIEYSRHDNEDKEEDWGF